jgi:hypothetical protein
MNSATDAAQGADAEAEPTHCRLESESVSAVSDAVIAAVEQDYRRVFGAAQRCAADDILLTVSFFPTATPKGRALGNQRRLTWGNFASVFDPRRVAR